MGKIEKLQSHPINEETFQEFCHKLASFRHLACFKDRMTRFREAFTSYSNTLGGLHVRMDANSDVVLKVRARVSYLSYAAGEGLCGWISCRRFRRTRHSFCTRVICDKYRVNSLELRMS